MEELLRVRGVERRFGARQVLDRLDFRMAPGDVLGLLGPNGAGKTTCLQILTGNLAPSAGSVAIRGHDMTRAPRQAKRHVGYLPERPPLYPEMRVDEYLVFCARLHRLPAAEISGALARAKSRCGLERVGRRLLGRLSKGYRQRIGLAQALIHEPELIVLDEPTDGLDPVQIREVRDLMRELAPAHGVILSSHALAEVQAICNRVIILRDGRTLLDAPLHAGETAGHLHVRLRRPRPVTEIAALAPVAEAEAVGEDPGTRAGHSGDLRIRLADGATPDQLAEALVAAGYGLLELRPERSDLERVFFGSLGTEAAA
jgi:ABC-2 type transport system ATP-binding protein